MASGLSNASRDDILNYIRGTAPTWAADTQFEYAITKANPIAGANVAGDELTLAGYARVAFTRSTGLTVSGGQLINVGAITFPKITDVGPGETATHVCIVTAAGRVIAICALPSPVLLVQDSVPVIADGALAFTAVQTV